VVIEPLLPLGERGPIPDLRRLVNGVMWRFRTGSPWRPLMLPAVFGAARALITAALFEIVPASLLECSCRSRPTGERR
jgi:transposase